jgi:hypothetical protein
MWAATVEFWGFPILTARKCSTKRFLTRLLLCPIYWCPHLWFLHWILYIPDFSNSGIFFLVDWSLFLIFYWLLFSKTLIWWFSKTFLRFLVSLGWNGTEIVMKKVLAAWEVSNNDVQLRRSSENMKRELIAAILHHYLKLLKLLGLSAWRFPFRLFHPKLTKNLEKVFENLQIRVFESSNQPKGKFQSYKSLEYIKFNVTIKDVDINT